MGILYYFVGCIPVAILSLLLNFFVEKIKLIEKIHKFDEANSGPIYEFFKTIFFIALFIFGIISIGICILPIYIFRAFADGNILEEFILVLIGSIMFSFYCMVFDR